MEPLSTVFLGLSEKTKEALDRKKVSNYEELIHPDNRLLCRGLNLSYQDLKTNYEMAGKHLEQFYNKPYDALEYIPKSHTNIISCAISPQEGQTIEVYGQKSSGKSCVLLQIANRYLKENPQKGVYILNGSSGITHMRLRRLPFDRVTYRDIYNIQQLNTALDEIPQLSDSNIGLVVIDGFLRLAKTFDKPKEQIKGVMSRLRYHMDKHKTKFVLQNCSVSDKVDLEGRVCYNNPSEFSWLISNSCQSRIAVHKLSKEKYRIFLLKSLYNCTSQYLGFEINDGGFIERA